MSKPTSIDMTGTMIKQAAQQAAREAIDKLTPTSTPLLAQVPFANQYVREPFLVDDANAERLMEAVRREVTRRAIRCAPGRSVSITFEKPDLHGGSLSFTVYLSPASAPPLI